MSELSHEESTDEVSQASALCDRVAAILHSHYTAVLDTYLACCQSACLRRHGHLWHYRL